MAQKTVVTLTDDLDGQAADETIRFGLDGVTYEIDLRRANATRLRETLQPYRAAARKSAAAVVVSRRKGVRGVRAITGDRERSAEIRAWAKKHGLQVSERGRIAAGLVEAYEANDPGKVSGKAVPQAAFSS
jgi:hypothetical protein